ncbi:hypothetical protein SORBI_3005G042600 [Sorghum bicolor]|uniref:RRM domain-containing protein n=1 Tax=Sorghum bicolor TaxID=4558 RepID=C5Y525_SORBI|nr:hypothetical protein SORBI_3005G042600 [Sorghum bicolor]
MAAAVTTVRDVLYHYTFARGLYERLISDCECHPQVARNVVALLLWFDQGTNKVISHLPSMSTTALGHLLNEGSCLIHCLRMRNVPAALPTPLLSALCQDSHMDDPDFFAVNQGHIARGVADLLDGVCTLIFDDRLYHLLRRYQTGLVGRNLELEAPYERVVVTVPEDCRSMFVTFSKGQPVERDDIFNYFRETWGDCIVRVLMEKTTGCAQPMYGRVIFKSKAFVSLVLNGVHRAPLFIGGREIWLRAYVPRRGSDNN